MNAYSDIFAETDDYAAKAREKVRMQMRAAARAKEATQIASRPVAEAQRVIPQTVSRHASPVERGTAVRQVVIDALTFPMPAATLAKRIGRDLAATARLLRRMNVAGLVVVVRMENIKGRDVGVWYKTGREVASSIRSSGRTQRQNATRRLLDVLDRPKTIAEIASALNRSYNPVSVKVAALAAAGILRREGTALSPTGRGRGRQADLWVRA